MSASWREGPLVHFPVCCLKISYPWSVSFVLSIYFRLIIQIYILDTYIYELLGFFLFLFFSCLYHEWVQCPLWCQGDVAWERPSLWIVLVLPQYVLMFLSIKAAPRVCYKRISSPLKCFQCPVTAMYKYIHLLWLMCFNKQLFWPCCRERKRERERGSVFSEHS